MNEQPHRGGPNGATPPVIARGVAAAVLAWCGIAGGVVGVAVWRRGATFWERAVFYAAVCAVVIGLLAFLVRRRRGRA